MQDVNRLEGCRTENSQVTKIPMTDLNVGVWDGPMTKLFQPWNLPASNLSITPNQTYIYLVEVLVN